MTKLEATIADLRIAASMTEPHETMDIPRVRVVELLDELTNREIVTQSVRAELEQLRAMQQRALEMRDGEGWSWEESCAARHVLGEPVGR